MNSTILTCFNFLKGGMEKCLPSHCVSVSPLSIQPHVLLTTLQSTLRLVDWSPLLTPRLCTCYVSTHRLTGLSGCTVLPRWMKFGKVWTNKGRVVDKLVCAQFFFWHSQSLGSWHLDPRYKRHAHQWIISYSLTHDPTSPLHSPSLGELQ